MNINQLNKTFFLKKTIDRLEEQLKELNNLGSAPITDMPKGTGTSDPTQKYTLKKTTIIEKLLKKYDEYLDEYNKIYDYINKIEDEEVKLIATLRFIDHKDWFYIAEEISPENKTIHWTTPRKKIKRYLERANDEKITID